MKEFNERRRRAPRRNSTNYFVAWNSRGLPREQSALEKATLQKIKKNYPQTPTIAHSTPLHPPLVWTSNRAEFRGTNARHAFQIHALVLRAIVRVCSFGSTETRRMGARVLANSSVDGFVGYRFVGGFFSFLEDCTRRVYSNFCFARSIVHRLRRYGFLERMRRTWY